jgi:flagellar hook-associated protein 1
MSNFSSLNTGLSALIAHRQAAEVISHNIANVNTEGFSRRRLDLQADGAPPVAALWSRKLTAGSGVRADGIFRIRDEFLEAQYRNESALSSALGSTNTVLARIETAFPEPSDSGIAEQFNRFWSAWDNIVNQPESVATRTSVVERARILGQALQQADRQLRAVHDDAVEHVRSLVDQINQYAVQIARYDAGIRAAVVSGQQPNDLLDQRDTLVEKLTALAGTTVIAAEHGTVAIYLGGRALVHDDVAEKIQVTEAADPVLGPLGFDRVTLSWAVDDYPVTLAAGELTGFVNGANELVPKYVTELDRVAAQLVTSVNAVHQTGKGLDGVSGRDFFDPAGTTARTFAVSAAVATNPMAVAAADPTKGELDTTVAEQLADLRRDSAGAHARYNSLVVSLGAEVQFTKQQGQMQADLVARLEDDRKAVSGVNLDEEMVNLVAAQHAYSAAARVITTVDEMLDILINRTGVVGR